MKKFIFIIGVAIGLFAASSSQAQLLNINYQMAAPSGESKDFINRMSFRGISIDYHHFVTNRLAVGLDIEWNTFYKNPKYKTDHFKLNGDPVTITGDQFRYLNVVPLLASARYFFTGENSAIYPYAGLGIGANWAETRLEVGHYVAEKDGWQFAIAPQIGCMIPFCEYVGAHIGVKYFYSVKTDDLPALQHVGIEAGLSFSF